MIHPERKAAAGRYGRLGWHTFRHTYRSWLDETGAPMKVQQELMRHASIQTTMNVYGQAMSSSKREANSKIVEVLKPALGGRQKPQFLLMGVSGSESEGGANRKSPASH
jgi:integrase